MINNLFCSVLTRSLGRFVFLFKQKFEYLTVDLTVTAILRK